MKIEELWNSLPKIDCKQKCQTSCGPIRASQTEKLKIIDYLKKRNKPFRIFKDLNQRKVQNHLQNNHDDSDQCLWCPYLKENKCDIYPVRPMICRLWGVVENMKCLWGCKPERYLTKEEGFEFLRKARELNI